MTEFSSISASASHERYFMNAISVSQSKDKLSIGFEIEK